MRSLCLQMVLIHLRQTYNSDTTKAATLQNKARHLAHHRTCLCARRKLLSAV